MVGKHIKVLEVNVDDLHTGGVYSLVKNVIEHSSKEIQIDIGAIEKFVNQRCDPVRWQGSGRSQNSMDYGYAGVEKTDCLL